MHLRRGPAHRQPIPPLATRPRLAGAGRPPGPGQRHHPAAGASARCLRPAPSAAAPPARRPRSSPPGPDTRLYRGPPRPAAAPRRAGRPGPAQRVPLRTHVQAQSGPPPHQYVLQRRLARAETLLRDTALPLAEIALACGFSSSSHLASRFRRARGLAPSQLRQSTSQVS
ncbi:helix-turn-helix transcriptional regulator [Bisbaumannia pacifica]|uniref:helix-turn-helix transcriptional regulator n=1 Tax=Bisbaumannia pacifica TaxID=77098 RepID=UPI003BEEE117